MMGRCEIQEMINNGSIKLNISQLVSHYFIVFYLLLIPSFVWIDAIKGEADGFDFLFGGAWIVASVYFYFVQKRRLMFKIIKYPTTSAAFNNAVDLTAKEFSWKITRINNDVVIAISSFNWRSWGERITIIRDNDSILFNSICDPDKKTSVASFGMNKLNRTTFEHFLRMNAETVISISNDI